MIEIILLNLAFWTIWYQVSKLPEKIAQYGIDNHHRL
jgi:hypothetical protein